VQLIQSFQGAQLRPGDAGYDEARALFNSMIDRRPALIAQCTDPDDVRAALSEAERERMRVAVRAGGHSVAGMSLVDNGVVIDVRPMKEIEIDVGRRVARVGAGVTWGELDAAAQEHGLATTGGRVSTTGVAGFTLGGGSGWLERSYGLACDNLIGAELVTAAGELVTADEELLWALRGGSGNFGVVTTFELQLHEVGPMIYGGLIAYPASEGRKVTRALRDFHQPGPDEAGLGVVYIYGPPEEFVPLEWQGELLVAIVGMWNGPVAEGEAALRPLLDVAEPVIDLFGEMPYTELQCMIDDPPGLRNWWTAEYMSDFPDEAVERFCTYSEEMPAPSQSIVFPWGGEVVRRAGSGAMARRDAAWVMHPFCLWEDARDDVKQITWGRRCRQEFAPWATGGTYLNFIGDEGQDRVRAAYGDSYGRLARIKAQYDPQNVFSGNQNIKPAG
jgi:FAD/FMN-containing dehydrogenase